MSHVQRRRAHFASAVVACVAAVAVTSGSAPEIARAASVPNACRLLHVTRSLAAKVYGPKPDVLNTPTSGGTPPNLGSACEVNQGIGARHFIGGINVEPYAASQYSALVASYRTRDSKRARSAIWGKGRCSFTMPIRPTTPSCSSAAGTQCCSPRSRRMVWHPTTTPPRRCI